MSILILSANEPQWTIPANSDVDIFGTAGVDNIAVEDGAKVNFRAGFKPGSAADEDQIFIQGDAADFTVVLNGTILTLTSSNGTEIVIPAGTVAQTLVFGDGAVDLQIAGGAVNLGNQPLVAGDPAVAVTATLDTTVTSDDQFAPPAPPTPEFTVSSAAASTTENTNAVFTVTLSSAQASATSVHYTLAGTGGADLATDTDGSVAATGTITFAAGETTKTITVPVAFDTKTETGEGLKITLSDASTGTQLGTVSSAETALVDPPVATFQITSDITEGTPVQEGKNITFTITPSGIVTQDTTLTVNLSGAVVGAITSEASANDFSAAQTVTFKAGETAARTTFITVTDDNVLEGMEGFKASLLDKSYTELDSLTGTITDPTLTYVLTGPTTVDEGTSATYTVTSDRVAPAGGVTIPYTITGNATAGTDFTPSATTGTITIPEGSTTGTLILNTTADMATEAAAENIIVTLGTPSTGNVTTGTVTTAINDTSKGLGASEVALSVSTTAVDEGNQVTYTVTLGTAAPAGGINVPYTLSGTSTLTSDYTGSAALTGNINVAAGATTGTLTLTTVKDYTTEGAETVINTITAPTGYTIATDKGTTTTTINDTSTTVVGESKALTTAVEAFTGTAGNDTYSAVIATGINNGQTFNTGDSIDGAAGNDTLNITVASNDTPITTLANLEYVNIIPGAATGAISAANWTGVQKITVSNSADFESQVTNIQNNVTLAMSNTAVVNTGKDSLSATFGAGKVGGTTATLNLEVSSAGVLTSGLRSDFVVDTTSDVFTTVNIAATGNNLVGLAAGGAGDIVPQTLNVSGTGYLSFALAGNIDFTKLETVNASSNSGGLAIDASASTKSLSVTGGSGTDTLTVSLLTQDKVTVNAGAGNDRVTIDGGTAITNTTTLNSTDSIVGGDGTDTLAMTAGTFNILQGDTDRSVITGFENILTTSDLGVPATPTYDISKFGINSLTVGVATDTAAATVNGFTSGATFTYASAADSSKAVNIGITGATAAGTPSDTLNAVFNSNLVANSGHQVLLGVDGINIINVKTNDSINTDNATSVSDGTGYGLVLSSDNAVTNITAVTGSDRAFTYTGSATALALQTIDLSLNTAITNINLDAGVFTQGVAIKSGAAGSYIFGTNKADAITGGAGNDVLFGDADNDIINAGNGTNFIDGGAGSDTMTGGSGVDTFVVSAVGDLASSYANAVVDTITNIDFTNDKIFTRTTAPASISNYTGASVDAQTTVHDAVTNVIDNAVGVNNAGLFTYKGDTYLYQDADGSASYTVADFLVKVTGYTGTLATTSFALPATNGATILGTAADDTLVGTALGDTITGRAGSDSITGGAGSDSITLGGADSARDVVKYISTTAANLALEGSDTITDFQTAATRDIFNFAAGALVNGTNNGYVNLTATAGTIGANDVIVTLGGNNFTSAADLSVNANALAIIDALDTSNVTTGDSVLVLLDNGTNTYAWLYTEGATGAGTVNTDELTLLATINGVPDAGAFLGQAPTITTLGLAAATDYFSIA